MTIRVASLLRGILVMAILVFFPILPAQMSENSRRLCFRSSEGKFGEISGETRDILSRVTSCFKYQDLGHMEMQTCPEPWVNSAPKIVRKDFL